MNRANMEPQTTFRLVDIDEIRQWRPFMFSVGDLQWETDNDPHGDDLDGKNLFARECADRVEEMQAHITEHLPKGMQVVHWLPAMIAHHHPFWPFQEPEETPTMVVIAHCSAMLVGVN